MHHRRPSTSTAATSVVDSWSAVLSPGKRCHRQQLQGSCWTVRTFVDATTFAAAKRSGVALPPVAGANTPPRKRLYLSYADHRRA